MVTTVIMVSHPGFGSSCSLGCAHVVLLGLSVVSLLMLKFRMRACAHQCKWCAFGAYIQPCRWRCSAARVVRIMRLRITPNEDAPLLTLKWMIHPALLIYEFIATCAESVDASVPSAEVQAVPMCMMASTSAEVTAMPKYMMALTPTEGRRP